ncbi:hypothetical protein Tco_1526612 [Tanacetum coccineum]
MHEFGDSHALGGPFHASSFNLELLHEILDGLSIPLLDIIDFHWILEIRGVNVSTSSRDQGTARSSSFVGLCLFNFDFQCPPSLVPLFDTRDNRDSLSLPFFMLRERSLSRE